MFCNIKKTIYNFLNTKGISILLASHNGEKYIAQSVESIINQTFKEWELLIGFNGTTDSSKDIIAKYNDRRIKIFDYGNEKGKAKTLNKLIKKAKYNWCAIQDDDDIWLPQKLEKQFSLTDSHDVIGTFIHYINKNNQIIGGARIASDHENIKRLSLSGINQVANSSAIFKKEAAAEINFWREDVDGIEDFDFWLKLLKSGRSFYNIPEYITLHRLHSSSHFNSQKSQNLKINEIL